MENTWDIITYLIDGCAISLLLFLIASVYMPGLKNIRPAYLRIANTTFALIGLVPLGILIYFYTALTTAIFDNDVFAFLFGSAPFILTGVLLLGIVPILAVFRKRNTSIWFTCLLTVSVWAFTHANAVAEWIIWLILRETPSHPESEGPMVKWYRIAFALLFFLLCYWFARRKVNRAAQS
ncbi:hypothetical protein [Chitinophaga sp.]|uniref:hypothetical protein n=1 Tax=Chitinophaga sp. TaxID=1869181 RepID=UPI0031DC61A7